MSTKDSKHKQPCTLQSVVCRFCVSVVYQKQKPGNILELALRSAVVEAVSKDEALGIMINNLSEEFTDWLLNLKCVVEL